MKTLLAVSLILMLSGCAAADQQTPADRPSAGDGKIVNILVWNIQNGMWSDQGNNYDNFVAWVKGNDPDICIC